MRARSLKHMVHHNAPLGTMGRSHNSVRGRVVGGPLCATRRHAMRRDCAPAGETQHRGGRGGRQVHRDHVGSVRSWGLRAGCARVHDVYWVILENVRRQQRGGAPGGRDERRRGAGSGLEAGADGLRCRTAPQAGRSFIGRMVRALAAKQSQKRTVCR